MQRSKTDLELLDLGHVLRPGARVVGFHLLTLEFHLFESALRDAQVLF